MQFTRLELDLGEISQAGEWKGGGRLDRWKKKYFLYHQLENMINGKILKIYLIKILATLKFLFETIKIKSKIFPSPFY